MRKIRIGIDVGGTFTDAVAIDDASGNIIAREKIPTTHDANEGVALGIIRVLENIMKRNRILPEEISFIAHGTTQATNALLEGDVAAVGILAMGSGLLAERVQNDTTIGDIPLASGKSLHTLHRFIRTDSARNSAGAVAGAMGELTEDGARVIVATEPFSVDDPENELFVINAARKQGLYATGGCEVSRLYGLRVRTRTAVINGSLIPRMMETADMTEACIKKAGIASPLMVMRCDGGVMTVEEVRTRPILTMLSGLAAGVAGALMYERMSDGIFLEAGGTSTDISAVRNGSVMQRYAQIGGHKTYLNSLDVRTLGVAGGSMIRIEKGAITGTGPRSAHIAGLPYEVFSEPVKDGRLCLISPLEEDSPVYAVVKDSDGRCVSLTLAGAANVLEKVPEGDYAKGNYEAALAAWTIAGKALDLTAREAAQKAMDLAAKALAAVVDSLCRDYAIPARYITLAGGGGSAGVIVPYLGEAMGLPWTIVKDAPIISTIGVALAMVREVVERTVVSPSEEDIRSIRQEALEQILKAGASEETVEITVAYDRQATILRATATGASELNTEAGQKHVCSKEELTAIAAASLGPDSAEPAEIAAAGKWHLFEGRTETKRFGLFPSSRFELRLLDRTGVIRLRKEGLGVIQTTAAELDDAMALLLERHTEYGTNGGQIPALYLCFGERLIDLSGLLSREQIKPLIDMETEALSPGTEIILIAAVR